MKKLYITLYSLTVICILATSLLLSVMPDTVPLHYNFAGEVDRFRSKYEFLIMHLITLVLTYILLITAKNQGKKEQKNSEKILVLIAIYSLVFFSIIQFFFQYKTLNYTNKPLSLDALKFITIMIGLFQIVFGNIMPKLRRNSFIGLRTSWSMSNDVVWQKSQRFAGISSVIVGIFVIIGTIFLNGKGSMIFMLTLITVWVAICIFFSYNYYRRYS